MRPGGGSWGRGGGVPRTGGGSRAGKGELGAGGGSPPRCAAGSRPRLWAEHRGRQVYPCSAPARGAREDPGGGGSASRGASELPRSAPRVAAGAASPREAEPGAPGCPWPGWEGAEPRGHRGAGGLVLGGGAQKPPPAPPGVRLSRCLRARLNAPGARGSRSWAPSSGAGGGRPPPGP